MLGLPMEELNLEESVKNLLLVGDISSIPQFCLFRCWLLARRAGVGDALVGRTYYLNMCAKEKRRLKLAQSGYRIYSTTTTI